MKPKCSYPIKDADPCRRVAVAEYRGPDGETYLRCKVHDARTVRSFAEAHGYERRELAA